MSTVSMVRRSSSLPVGLSNNIDLRGNLAVASNDGVNALSWFRIDPATAMVTHAGDTKLAAHRALWRLHGRVPAARCRRR